MNYNNVSSKMINNEEYKYFHVFTDDNDEYFDCKENYTTARKEAFIHRDSLLKQGAQNIRVYYVSEMLDYRDGHLTQMEETCLYAIGNYPS